VKVALHKLLPFALTLAAGLLLAGSTAPTRPSRQSSRTEAARRREHSKTWLVVTSLPGRTQRIARGGGPEGRVRMRVVFGEGGIVRDVRAETADVPGATDEDAAAFAREALDAAGRVRFRPATVDGRPVALGASIEYTCSSYHAMHTALYECGLSIVEVENDWRIIYE
jgi:hypothetical protein